MLPRVVAPSVKTIGDRPKSARGKGNRRRVRIVKGCARDTAMIKLVTFQKRAPSLSRPAFEDRWRTIHGPMAARFPGLRAYMLGFSIEPGEPPADGVAQLWFDNREACQASYASDIGRSGSADAIQYLARREHLLASERWVLRGGSLAQTPFKLLICGKRRTGMERAAFCEWWGDFLPALAGQVGAVSARIAVDDAGLLLNSKTGGELTLIAGEAVHDGLLEYWFADRAALENALALVRKRYTSLLNDRLGRHEIAALTEEVVVRPPADIYGEMEPVHG